MTDLHDSSPAPGARFELDDEAFAAAFDRFLTSETGAADRARLCGALSVRPDADALLERVHNHFHRAPLTAAHMQADRDRLLARVRAEVPARRTRVRRGTERTRTYAGFAGLVVALVALFTVVVPTFTSHRHDATTPNVVHRTGRGERATVTLADGSRVVLAPQSAIRIAAGFGEATRTIALDGEAYFEVEHTAGAPFVVNAGGVATRVLGTTFTVRHYAGDTDVQVSVEHGKVLAASTGGRLTLTAGTAGRLTDSSAVADRAPDLTARTAWTRGKLSFADEPLPRVLASLGRWYGYDFTLADTTLARARLSAVFDANAPKEALVVLREVLDVSVVVNGSRVTLGAREVRTPRRQTAPARRDTQGSVFLPSEVGK